MPRLHSLIVAALALSVIGCGTSGTPAGDGSGARPQSGGPAAGSTGLRVTATDGRVGDATQADSRGVTQLKVDPVRGGSRARRDGVGAGAACADVGLMPDPGNLGAVVNSTLCLLNGERADAGLPPLALNDKLAAAADAHSREMVASQFFEHMAPDGRDVVDRVRATGYIPTDRRWLVGENLAWGTGVLATPASIVAAWMNSSGHRENILRAEYREIGFGVVLGNPRSTDGAGATYTTNFGAVSSEEAVETQPIAATRDDDRRAAARRRARAQRRARAARRARAHRHARAARAARRARLSRAKGPRARIALGPRARRR